MGIWKVGHRETKYIHGTQGPSTTFFRSNVADSKPKVSLPKRGTAVSQGSGSSCCPVSAHVLILRPHSIPWDLRLNPTLIISGAQVSAGQWINSAAQAHSAAYHVKSHRERVPTLLEDSASLTALNLFLSLDYIPLFSSLRQVDDRKAVPLKPLFRN